MPRLPTYPTIVRQIDPQAPDPQIIAEAAACLREGGLVAFPTETVYGLGANALKERAVRRLFVAKGRPLTDPLIVHIARNEQLQTVARAIPAVAWRLVAAFWPGPLTLVLWRAPAIPPLVSAGLPTVAVRRPSHLVALALLAAAGVPVVAPSANRFGHTSPTRAEHVLADLAGRIEMILDAGPTPVGVESTVLDLTVEPAVVLRPGGVTVEALSTVLGYTPQVLERAAGPVKSPGLLERHYAPAVPLILIEGPAERARAALRQRALALASQGRRVGLLLYTEDQAALGPLPARVVDLGSLRQPEEVARRLFTALRTLEAAGVDVILARSVPDGGLWLAIRDRLRRASSEVVSV
jgi:L-threonylcarbamoyladenylate synthase